MATQPVEDIDAVLGRFQAWAGAREAAGVKAGVREISDEEALASGRYRWKPEHEVRVKPAVSPAQPSIAPPVAAGGRSKAATEKKSEPKRSAMKRKNHSASRAQSPAKPSPRKEEKTQSAFREVLAEAVKPAEVLVKAQPVELSRQVAISIRLAPAERALIKTRAAEAGITASAYIRQCALEVEQLRDQVRRAVGAMERGGRVAPEASVVAQAPSRGFFAWMARKFLPRRSPALALRA